jgi:hypothetical protein
VLAAYTLQDVLWTIVVFLLWIAYIGVGIWLLIRLFRNKNFISGHRGLRIVVKVLLVVLTLFVPVIGLVVLFVIWYSTRSTSAVMLEASPTFSPATPDTDQAQSTTIADGATHRPRLPFPPPPDPKDTPRL